MQATLRVQPLTKTGPKRCAPRMFWESSSEISEAGICKGAASPRFGRGAVTASRSTPGTEASVKNLTFAHNILRQSSSAGSEALRPREPTHEYELANLQEHVLCPW